MPQVIFLVGPSYCGSTVLSYVLGSLPDAAGVSESRRLLGKGRGCTVCQRLGRNPCPYLSRDVRWKRETLYADLAERFGVQTLITGDKIPLWGERLGSGCQVEYLVLFRSGLQLASSHKRHRTTEGPKGRMTKPGRRRGTQAPKLWRPEDYLDRMEASYAQQMEQRDPNAVFLDYGYFIAHKEGVLRRLCERYGLTFDASAIQYWEHEHHGISGNWGAILGMQEQQPQPSDLPDLIGDRTWYQDRRYDEIHTDRRWESELSPEEIETCLTHPYSRVYAKMAGRFMAWLQEDPCPT